MSEEREDAMAMAKRLMRPELAKRFYKSADIQPAEAGYAVVLDGRGVRTPGRNPVVTPWESLSQALAAEWNAQVDVINPSTMPLSRIVNSAIDGVARDSGAVRAEVVKYSGSDLICYRAEGPERLVARQAEAWDPILSWAERQLGSRFVLAQGVVFISQPPETSAAMDRALADLDTFRLAAVNVVTTLTGSALIALALLHGHLTLAEAWGAAHVDEDWNNELWGADEEAEVRRARRFEELRAAGSILQMGSREAATA
ncbi:ATP12 family chaperone protein [Terrihabitans rhizophilus]|uniref:ATP12 family protein n=1 Tax=Terrihabitans rhizophilus TaxID=3092662 RepID=A0ABU4RJY3_9HYPH|nr:ATP12 family protein [Terrihabitans sp. PJ23]MDX6805147.1 ATP12 family protein [Terrihabitans sp. PJ23]